MSTQDKGYRGPNLHIVIKRASDSEHRWQLTMRASDAVGARKLGYRASGRLNNSNDLIFDSSPQVHDEMRAVWTTMNDTDRPDIRERICSLVLKAREKLEASEGDTFEHLIN